MKVVTNTESPCPVKTQTIINQHRGTLNALAAYDRGECVCPTLGHAGPGHDEICPKDGTK